MNRWLLAGALAFATASQALASDLPPPAPPPPPRTPAAYVPPVLPVYNWGGLYFGFNVGYGFGKSNWVDAQDPGGPDRKLQFKGFSRRSFDRLQFPDRLLRSQRRGGLRWVFDRRQNI